MKMFLESATHFGVVFCIIFFSNYTGTLGVLPKCQERSYDFSFVRAQNGVLYTPTYQFVTYGSPSITHEASDTTVHLNKIGQYIELPNHGLDCIQDMTKCHNGFTLSVDVKFHTFSKWKTYIFSSGSDYLRHTGVSMYIWPNKNLTCAAKHRTMFWTSLKKLNVRLGEWHTYLVSWNAVTGFEVYIDGTFFMKQSKVLQIISQPITSPLLIGKGTPKRDHNTTLMDIKNLYVWTAPLDQLLDMGCDVYHYGLLHSSDRDSDDDDGDRVQLALPYWMKYLEVGIVLSVTLIVLMSVGCLCRRCCLCLIGVRKNKEEEKRKIIQAEGIGHDTRRKSVREHTKKMKNLDF